MSKEEFPSQTLRNEEVEGANFGQESGPESFDQKRQNWLSEQEVSFAAKHPHLYASGLTIASGVVNFATIELFTKAAHINMPEGQAAAMGAGVALTLYRLFLAKAKKMKGNSNE